MSGQGGVAIRIAAKKSAGGAGILKRIDRAKPFFESWDEVDFHGAMDGTVLIFSVRGDKDGDKIYVNRSEDGGTTWSGHQFIGNHVELDWKALNIGPYDGKGWGRDKKFAYASLGTSVVDENTGEIMFFMTALHPAPYMYKSQDHGKTWKLEKIELKKDIKGYLTNPNPACDPGITIKHGPHKGRLLAPARVMVDYNKHAEAKGYTNAVYSDDHGKTWFSSEPFPLDGTGESGLVELSDGTIYFNSRTHTRKGNRWIADSDDSGETWRDCHEDDELFDGPPDMYGCKAALLRLDRDDRDDGDILLFSSPDPSLPEKQNRANLNVWASFNGGKTWPVNRLIKTSKPVTGGLKVKEPVQWRDDFKLGIYVATPLTIQFNLEGKAKLYAIGFDELFWE
jgi:hypothetical protein